VWGWGHRLNDRLPKWNLGKSAVVHPLLIHNRFSKWMAHWWVLLGHIILPPLSGRGKKQNSLMHTILKVFPTWRICRLETYKFWSCLEIQLHYYRLLPTPYTCRLAVCQQVPTEMDRKKKTPTHSSSLFNEFQSNSPFSFFFFLSNTFVHFPNQRCVYK
jgi:hypothetical protein